MFLLMNNFLRLWAIISSTKIYLDELSLATLSIWWGTVRKQNVSLKLSLNLIKNWISLSEKFGISFEASYATGNKTGNICLSKYLSHNYL